MKKQKLVTCSSTDILYWVNIQYDAVTWISRAQQSHYNWSWTVQISFEFVLDSQIMFWFAGSFCTAAPVTQHRTARDQLGWLLSIKSLTSVICSSNFYYMYTNLYTFKVRFSLPIPCQTRGCAWEVALIKEFNARCMLCMYPVARIVA